MRCTAPEIEYDAAAAQCSARRARQFGEVTLQRRAAQLKLPAMHPGELCENLASTGGKDQHDFAPVLACTFPVDEFFAHQAIGQSDGAVVLDQKLPGEIVDRHFPVIGTCAQYQHRLI